MGLFDKLSGSKISNQNNKLAWPGDYDVEVVNVLHRQSQQHEGDEFYVIELKVLRSSHPDVKVGDVRGHTIPMGKNNTDGRIAAFIVACVGRVYEAETDEVKAQIDAKLPGWAEASITQNALQGKKLSVSVAKARTRADRANPQGVEYGLHNWRPFGAPAPVAAVTSEGIGPAAPTSGVAPNFSL
jgi:hypothetical protein